MKIKNAEHKAMIYKTLCTGHYTGEHLEGLSGAPRCNQLDASVLDQGCIQVVFRLSFCWMMVFVMVICYSAQNRSTYFQSSESLTTLALKDKDLVICSVVLYEVAQISIKLIFVCRIRLKGWCIHTEKCIACLLF